MADAVEDTSSSKSHHLSFHTEWSLHSCKDGNEINGTATMSERLTEYNVQPVHVRFLIPLLFSLTAWAMTMFFLSLGIISPLTWAGLHAHLRTWY